MQLRFFKKILHTYLWENVFDYNKFTSLRIQNSNINNYLDS